MIDSLLVSFPAFMQEQILHRYPASLRTGPTNCIGDDIGVEVHRTREPYDNESSRPKLAKLFVLCYDSRLVLFLQEYEVLVYIR